MRWEASVVGREHAEGADRDASFDAFFAREYPNVERALALVLGDWDLAADATQEAMARAFARWPTVSGYANASGWVFRVGLNHSRSRLRRIARLLLVRPPDGAARPVEPADPQVAVAVGRLPVEQRAVVVLRFWLDWTVEQTAHALDIAPGTVKSRQHRALATLREHLEDHDVG
ncbi:MAG TPA: sigma-70 family RNA polymerase sigma factor [Nitriliruptorales bacterium]